MSKYYLEVVRFEMTIKLADVKYALRQFVVVQDVPHAILHRLIILSEDDNHIIYSNRSKIGETFVAAIEFSQGNDKLLAQFYFVEWMTQDFGIPSAGEEMKRLRANVIKAFEYADSQVKTTFIEIDRKTKIVPPLPEPVIPSQQLQATFQPEFCANCGMPNQQENIFCPKCGTRMAEENTLTKVLVCAGCGSKLDDEDMFCLQCGLMISPQKTDPGVGKETDTRLSGDCLESMSRSGVDETIIQIDLDDLVVGTISVGSILEIKGLLNTWRVLDFKDDNMLVITDSIIGLDAYDAFGRETTWNECSIRYWLNSKFIHETISTGSQTRIVEITIENADNETYETPGGEMTFDKVFLLDYEEAYEYFSHEKDRVSVWNPTDEELKYMSARFDKWSESNLNNICIETESIAIETDGIADLIEENDGAWDWWLRSPGSYDSFAMYVDCDGVIQESGYRVDYEFVGVRPAMWLNLASLRNTKGVASASNSTLCSFDSNAMDEFYCEECGVKILARHKFCPKCGNDLRKC